MTKINKCKADLVITLTHKYNMYISLCNFSVLTLEFGFVNLIIMVK